MQLRANTVYDVRIDSEGVSVWVRGVTWEGTLTAFGRVVLRDATGGTTVLDSFDRIVAAQEVVTA